MITMENLLASLQKPEPYQPGASLWTHPHIAAEMLKAHLAPDTDAASYRPQTIDAICDHLTTAMGLLPGSRVVDLGCGPGLYCYRLAGRGLRMTGIDQSENSLRYARELCEGREATFRQMSYLQPFGEEAFDGALLISQDYGVLPPEQRKTLLGNIHAALGPGGRFALDVPTLAALDMRRGEPAATWESANTGFWRAAPYLTLHAVHVYPERNVLCDHYVVLDGEITVYRVWQTFFTVDTLRRELTDAGFVVESIGSSLKGEAWRDDSQVLAMVCRKG